MTSVPEWLHGKASELEADNVYGNVAQWVRQLADELETILRPASPQQTQAASSASLSEVTAPS